jgi:tRNA pseudouridine55 synthase
MALFGLLNLNKPTGVTSRRIVDRVQRLVRPAKVGHAGTLDPLASGVLVIGIGQATRLVEYVQQMPKRYRATFLLGRSSTTEDVEGEVTVSPDATQPTRQDLERVAAELTGEIEQRPPAFSALKVSGQRAYTLARAGHAVDLAPRTVHVHRLEIARYDYPELQLDVQCGGGTYIRSLGRDLAERAGTVAVMSALVRAAIGPFTLETAIDPAQLTADNLAQHLLPAVTAIQGLMSVRVVSEAEVGRLANGLPIDAGLEMDTPCGAVDADGTLVAIVDRRADAMLAPLKYFPSR